MQEVPLANLEADGVLGLLLGSKLVLTVVFHVHLIAGGHDLPMLRDHDHVVGERYGRLCGEALRLLRVRVGHADSLAELVVQRLEQLFGKPVLELFFEFLLGCFSLEVGLEFFHALLVNFDLET